MSRQTARVVLDQLHLRPAFIAARYATQNPMGPTADVTSALGLIGDIRELASLDMEKEQGAKLHRRREVASAYGFQEADQPLKPFIFSNGKAIIPIHGLLLNRFPYSMSFATGYSFIRGQVDAAMADPDVDGIIYDVNSYGGLVTGCEETSNVMKMASKAGGGKPSLAVVDANCYSAAYMLASAADKLIVTPSGGAGSIGVVLMHMDMSKMLDEIGVKVTFIHAGDHKVDGNAYEPLSKEVTSDLQALVDKMYDKFVATVTRNRPGLSDEAVRETQARCYQADEALALGLIDAVQTPPDALQAFFNAEDAEDDTGDEPSATTQEDTTMADPKPAEQTAAAGPTAEQAAAEARTAERDRIKAILALPEAEGRTDLANHLALTTDMTPDAAKGILNASPKKEAAAVEQTPAKTEPEQNHFRNAMNKSGGPNVGGNEAAAETGAEGKPSRAQQILGSQRRLTGAKPAQTADSGRVQVGGGVIAF